MTQQIFLVSGANGFVGSNLARHLMSHGVRVRALVRNEEKAQELRSAGADIVIGDLLDSESLKKACDGVTGVYHIAALFNQAGIPESVFFEVNVEGTRRLLDAAVASGAGRFIHCSTNGVHGNVKNPPADELVPYSPCDEYQRSKVEGEKVALDYFRSGRISGAVIRPAMIYGPGDTRLFRLFRMIRNGTFFYVGSGDVWCHFIDVRDLAEAFRLAMEKTGINGEAYLIAGSRPVKLRDFVDFAAVELGVRKPWLHIPVRPMQLSGALCEAICRPFKINPPLYRRRVDFFVKNRCFNTGKARRDLEFTPARQLEDEIRNIIQWYRERGML